MVTLILYLAAVGFFIAAGAGVKIQEWSPRWEWFGIACLTAAYFLVK